MRSHPYWQPYRCKEAMRTNRTHPPAWTLDGHRKHWDCFPFYPHNHTHTHIHTHTKTHTHTHTHRHANPITQRTVIKREWRIIGRAEIVSSSSRCRERAVLTLDNNGGLRGGLPMDVRRHSWVLGRVIGATPAGQQQKHRQRVMVRQWHYRCSPAFKCGDIFYFFGEKNVLSTEQAFSVVFISLLMSARAISVTGHSSPSDAETLCELPGVMLQTMQNPSRGTVCWVVVQ